MTNSGVVSKLKDTHWDFYGITVSFWLWQPKIFRVNVTHKNNGSLTTNAPVAAWQLLDHYVIRLETGVATPNAWRHNPRDTESDCHLQKCDAKLAMFLSFLLTFLFYHQYALCIVLVGTTLWHEVNCVEQGWEIAISISEINFRAILNEKCSRDGFFANSEPAVSSKILSMNYL